MLGFAWWLAGFLVFRGAKVFLAGGIFFFLFNGFRRQRFERLSDAVFQGQISSCFRSDSRGAYLAPRFSLLEAFFSFFLVGSVGNVSRVFRACVSRALGTNSAAV